MRICVVGAGLSGGVIGRSLAEAGCKVLIIDERLHVAGNCHTRRDERTGVMKHVYGPHIFHTADENVWAYVQRFATMRPYRHRVRAVARGSVYSLPINLLTINQFFGKALSPQEARSLIQAKATHIESPKNFEEQALASVGQELYETFFRGYTIKQWGVEAHRLPASVLKRLPLRFNYDDDYFGHPHQAIPEQGYTDMVEKILTTPNLEVRLGARFEEIDEAFAHVIYSGPLDRFFGFELGRLGYRTLDFETFYANGDYQGVAVMNYCDDAVPFTRITEHKEFAPWEKDRFADTVCYREYSRACGPQDIPFYPLRLTEEEALLKKYVARARATPGVTFVGRLGSYRYLDMDVAVSEALVGAREIIACMSAGAPIPAFLIPP